MVFCNLNNEISEKEYGYVTILILVDGFLQYYSQLFKDKQHTSHNPYFSRWFSAILKTSQFLANVDYVTILILVDGFLQCGKNV